MPVASKGSWVQRGSERAKRTGSPPGKRRRGSRRHCAHALPFRPQATDCETSEMTLPLMSRSDKISANGVCTSLVCVQPPRPVSIVVETDSRSCLPAFRPVRVQLRDRIKLQDRIKLRDSRSVSPSSSNRVRTGHALFALHARLSVPSCSTLLRSPCRWPPRCWLRLRWHRRLGNRPLRVLDGQLAGAHEHVPGGRWH